MFSCFTVFKLIELNSLEWPPFKNCLLDDFFFQNYTFSIHLKWQDAKKLVEKVWR